MRAMQPGVGGTMALYSPSSSVISPYGLTIGLAENALANGVRFFLGQRVTSLASLELGRWRVGTAGGESFEAALVVNSAGLFSADVSAMAGIADYSIYPCRGEYYVLDKRLEGCLRTLVYPAPKRDAPGLGIHLTPTVDGNILVGPSAEYLDDPDDCGCTAEVMRELRREAQELLPDICVSDYIRSFSGIRPKRTPPEVGGNADFVIEDRGGEAGLINLVGIESPGLTSAPAIAELVRDMVGRRIPLVPNPRFDPIRPGRELRFSELPAEERAELASKDPGYGEIVCRCERVTKREILEAVGNPLGARTLASIKYRARAGMGRCQGGFCLPRIVRILREELGWGVGDFLGKGASSPLLAGEMRPGLVGWPR
jgi:glycerol-3-phosphate dehydrogenase